MTEITDEWVMGLWREAGADYDYAATLIKAHVSALMAERDAAIASLSEAARAVSFTLDEKDAQIVRLREIVQTYLDDCSNDECIFCERARQALGATHEQG